MSSTLSIVLPIFALILAGFLARRIGILGPNASSELNRYVIYLALPALLFDVVARASWAEFWQPDFVATFALGGGALFAATVFVRRRQGRHLADAGIDGLNGAYANAGFIGVPLCLSVFGPQSLPAASIGMILTVGALFAVAIVVIEVGLQKERHLGRLVLRVTTSIVRNPLLIAPVLGAVVAGIGYAPPQGVESFLHFLGGSATPCALVGLGLFLGEKRPVANMLASAPYVALKLVGQPLLTWVLAYKVFHLPPMLAEIAVLLAALPTGTGSFMLAEFYRRDAELTSNTILVSTVLSLLTVSAFLTWGRG